jgi:hypothetical protein
MLNAGHFDVWHDHFHGLLFIVIFLELCLMKMKNALQNSVLILFAWPVFEFCVSRELQPITLLHWINWNAAFHFLYQIITKLPLSPLISFYFIFFFPFHFILIIHVQKSISNSFLVQIWWDFLHYSPCDV